MAEVNITGDVINIAMSQTPVDGSIGLSKLSTELQTTIAAGGSVPDNVLTKTNTFIWYNHFRIVMDGTNYTSAPAEGNILGYFEIVGVDDYNNNSVYSYVFSLTKNGVELLPYDYVSHGKDYSSGYYSETHTLIITLYSELGQIDPVEGDVFVVKYTIIGND